MGAGGAHLWDDHIPGEQDIGAEKRAACAVVRSVCFQAELHALSPTIILGRCMEQAML